MRATLFLCQNVCVFACFYVRVLHLKSTGYTSAAHPSCSDCSTPLVASDRLPIMHSSECRKGAACYN